LFEGVRVEKKGRWVANVVLTATTKIIGCLLEDKPVERKGLVPARIVVIPGKLYQKISSRKNFKYPAP